MSIGSVSFFQQDQSYWNQSQSFATQDQNYLANEEAIDQASTADASLMSAVGSAQTDQVNGMASLATKEALARVNKQIAADEAALNGTSTTPKGPTAAVPATAVGTVPLTANTTLATLGIPPGGDISVSSGIYTTTYNSTGTDTVGDLVNAINANVAGNAYVNAYVNSSTGKLTIVSKDQASVTVGGTFASDVGFGPGHQVFNYTPATPATSSSSSTTSSATGSSSTTSSTTSTTASKSVVPTLASEDSSEAAGVLSDFGVAGSLVNMLV